MKRYQEKSDYYQYTRIDELRKQAVEKSALFIKEEIQFQLGHLPTEQPHPYTMDFSRTIQDNPARGIQLLLKTDADIPPVARRVLLGKPYSKLVDSFGRILKDKKRLCFSGCGSTGRLSILLEKMWREYWEDRAAVSAGDAARYAESNDEFFINANLACSIMTGGDRALIRSVEHFEDFNAFGRRQVSDYQLSEGDLLIAITEGGETSSVLGTAEQALARGCQVFLIFNNPASILRKTIDRSRHLIEHPEVEVLDLFTGPMALSGSTRMQATTMEMLIIGSAMEEALVTAASSSYQGMDRMEHANRMAVLIEQLCSEKNLELMAKLASMESCLYKSDRRVVYLLSRFLLDVFTDTTERSPTFMLPPLRPADDHTAPVSWSEAKDPSRSSNKAWFAMLRRAPRGIDWNERDYRFMQAPQTFIDNPPSLGASEIARYMIGMENVDDGSSAWFLRICVGNITENIESTSNESLLHIGGADNSMQSDNVYSLTVDLPESPVYLWHHIAVKLVMNTISTASMGMMGRIRGNWMIQVDPTNKKLIDRATRIVSHLAGISYSKACEEIHLSMLAREAFRKDGGQTVFSPVIDALNRLNS